MSSSSKILRGITWSHTRGFVPMVATAQRFHELHREIEIVWEKRSLRAFEEHPLENLAAEYDLIVLDHPFVGYAAEHRVLVPLDEHLPAAYLADQAANSVGGSHPSYTFAGHHWALAIDAAAPVAFWREDLLAQHGLTVPQTWEQVLELARRGHVEVPGAPINCLMNFYSLCIAAGETPFAGAERIVSRDVGGQALRTLRELLQACDHGGWERNPIGSHDLVASTANQRVVYCPLAYGYSNYAREGYAAHRLTFGEPPTFGGRPLQSTLGGTGLAVSNRRPHLKAAVAYAQFVGSASVQRTLYARAGGQPGHRAAWLDATNNRLTHDYFTRTLPALDRAYLRPRYAGYLDFQQAAGPVVHDALRGTTSDDVALAQLDTLYRESLRSNPVAR